jgi:hypothetical protein
VAELWPELNEYAEPPMSRADDTISLGALRVQAVLDDVDEATFRRFAQAAAATCACAKRAGVIGAVFLAVADISAEPWVSAAHVDEEAGTVFDGTRYLRLGDELGPAAAHNRLFALGDEEPDHSSVLVMSSRAYTAPRLVCELTVPFTDPTVGIAEARQLPLELPKSHDLTSGDTSWASASCLLVRRQVVEDTGGFDSQHFEWWGHDIDLSWRARRLGWRVVHRPGARVYVAATLTTTGARLEHHGDAAQLRRHRAVASVMLPWRYSRQDLAIERLTRLASSSDAAERAVAEELTARIDAGRMPEPIDPHHEVGQFVAGGYAAARFSYATS